MGINILWLYMDIGGFSLCYYPPVLRWCCMGLSSSIGKTPWVNMAVVHYIYIYLMRDGSPLACPPDEVISDEMCRVRPSKVTSSSTIFLFIWPLQKCYWINLTAVLGCPWRTIKNEIENTWTYAYPQGNVSFYSCGKGGYCFALLLVEVWAWWRTPRTLLQQN